MELPELGQNCSEKTCNMLDFLPMKCDACSQVFCKDHIHYFHHSCPSSHKKDVQVPVCPLCNQPVPGRRGDPPDLAVGDHIDRDCQSDPAKQKRKVMTNRCTLKGCKQKEMIPVICSGCKSNFCLKHRHHADHNCRGNNPADRAREAALARVAKPSKSSSSSSKQHQPRNTQSIQGNFSEDEALAMALQASLSHSEARSVASNIPGNDQEQADLMLAIAMQESEREEQERRLRETRRVAEAGGGNSDRCCIS
uniref:EOG090X0APF n=1 Tax=Lynceus sp. MCZ IZ 141354 TaxID=1930659 RepID=A0A9N6WTA4_9CRUS|nr:EOG090X0APF [Lynceus sp. MCZ IZ 141354]